MTTQSPPVAEPKLEAIDEPKVGETWYSDTYQSTWGPLLVKEVIGTRGIGSMRFRCWSEAYEGGEHGVFEREDLNRRLAASIDETVAPDPYQNFPHGMNDAQIAAAMVTREKLDSARADLDRPTRPKRFGRLGELDRYGAKLSSVGWETED